MDDTRLECDFTDLAMLSLLCSSSQATATAELRKGRLAGSSRCPSCRVLGSAAVLSWSRLLESWGMPSSNAFATAALLRRLPPPLLLMVVVVLGPTLTNVDLALSPAEQGYMSRVGWQHTPSVTLSIFFQLQSLMEASVPRAYRRIPPRHLLVHHSSSLSVAVQSGVQATPQTEPDFP
jgi:hypothetical protein